MLETTRELDGQSEKRRSIDFALWKKASPEHIMRWKAPWSEGFPGWHMECSAMGTKYLGEEFDIHGGGMDLMFPHHECEIAQNKAGLGKDSVKYWMHNNMITIGGQKMGKSLGNFITLDEFFEGKHDLLSQAFSAMTIRFFILQAHYRSTVDFSSAALEASEKGLNRLMEGYARLQKLSFSPKSTVETAGLRAKCEEAMNDDLNTPIVISHLFDALRAINLIHDGKETISEADLTELQSVFSLFIDEILGLKSEEVASAGNEAYKKAIDMLLNMRMEAKRNKDWATSDKIRNELTALGFVIKDTKEGFEWSI
jgi:cysteinyl-tRNA synthetase